MSLCHRSVLHAEQRSGAGQLALRGLAAAAPGARPVETKRDAQALARRLAAASDGQQRRQAGKEVGRWHVVKAASARPG